MVTPLALCVCGDKIMALAGVVYGEKRLKVQKVNMDASESPKIVTRTKKWLQAGLCNICGGLWKSMSCGIWRNVVNVVG